MYYQQNYQTHVRTFDSVEDLIASCQAVRESAIVNSNSFNQSDWVGRAFYSWPDVYSAARSPWDDGCQIVDHMVEQLEATNLPRPKSRKRKTRFAQDDGSELDYDRLRSGQEFWRRCERQNTAGPQTVTIVIDVNAHGGIEHEDILWRGAAAIAMTHVLEQADFRVELWVIHCADKCYSNGTGHCHAVCLKRAGDPLDSATFAAAVSGWFYRSLMFRAKCLNGAPKATLGRPRPPMRSEVTLVTNDPNAIVISGVYSEYGAVYLAREALKRLAGIEDPPPPPPETEPVVTDEPTPEPVNVEPPKPKTKAEIRAEQAAQRKADREYKQWLKQRERENVEVR
jgi:hypothetical protein